MGEPEMMADDSQVFIPDTHAGRTLPGYLDAFSSADSAALLARTHPSYTPRPCVTPRPRSA